MITKKANKRLQILLFWDNYGLEATKDAYKVKRSTLYSWKKIYKESGQKIESLNPKSQAPHNKRKRITDYRVVNEIRRLRTEVCPNMGKDKMLDYQALFTISLEKSIQLISPLASDYQFLCVV